MLANEFPCWDKNHMILLAVWKILQVSLNTAAKFLPKDL